MIHKRKLTIAAAAIAIALATASKADGQHVRASFNARPMISGPMMPTVPTMPIIISPSQWTINNPMLKPTLSALPTVAPAPAIAPALTIAAVQVEMPTYIAAAVPVTAPVVIQAAQTEVPITRAETAVQQSALGTVFEGRSAEGKAKDMAKLIGEMQSNINAQAGKLKQSIAADKERRTKSLIHLNKGQSEESDDYVIKLEEIRVTPDGAGSAHLTVRSKHSREVIDLHIGNEELKFFTIVNVKERWQKVFSVRANMNDQVGAVALDIRTVMKGEIYTQNLKHAKEEKTVALEIGEGVEVGAGGMEIVTVKGDRVKIHFGHGETEFERWFKLGEKREIVFEEEDLHQTFIIEVIGIGTKNGKTTVDVQITEK